MTQRGVVVAVIGGLSLGLTGMAAIEQVTDVDCAGCLYGAVLIANIGFLITGFALGSRKQNGRQEHDE